MAQKIKLLISLPELLGGVKPLAWPALYAILLLVSMGDYLPWEQPNFWLGLIGLLCYIRYPLAEKGNYRFLAASILFLLIYLFLPVKTVFFFAILFAFLYAVEAISGKLSLGILAIAFLMSPVANYAAEVFSFPIRLQLSALAAGILDFTGKAALAKGNTIFYNGLDFDVDQACMGLNMLVSSMLVALLSLWIFEKKWQRRMPYHALPLILGVFFITNLLANLFRIILLVYFEIPPENWMHETIGIICWLVYGIIPGVAILRHLLKQWGGYERVIPVKKYPEPALRFYGLSQVGLFVVLSVLIHTTGLRSHYGENGPSLSRTDIPGFNKKKLEDGVTSFSNDQALIYIKPVRGFYSTDHNPAICWKGSGYAFHKIMATSIQATPVYQAELTKEGSRLHTAWWYESGSHRTNSQWVWRKDNFKNGMPYVLVNVTASTEKGLEVAVKNWMQQRDAVLSLQP